MEHGPWKTIFPYKQGCHPRNHVSSRECTSLSLWAESQCGQRFHPRRQASSVYRKTQHGASEPTTRHHGHGHSRARTWDGGSSIAVQTRIQANTRVQASSQRSSNLALQFTCKLKGVHLLPHWQSCRNLVERPCRNDRGTLPQNVATAKLPHCVAGTLELP